MSATWKQDDVFPIIAKLISTRAVEGRYVTHDEIVNGLFEEPEAVTIIEQAHEQQQEQNRSIEWFAHNMVAWFSQQITVGHSQWSNEFDRKNIDGKWAYRPAKENAN